MSTEARLLGVINPSCGGEEEDAVVSGGEEEEAVVTPSCGGEEEEAVVTPSSLEEEDTVTASALNIPSLPRSLPPSLPRASALSVHILVFLGRAHRLLAGVLASVLDVLDVLVFTRLANPCEKASLERSSQTLAAKKSPQCLCALKGGLIVRALKGDLRAPCTIAPAAGLVS